MIPHWAVSCNGLTPGQPFPGNVICPNRISPKSQSLIQYIPDPDGPGSGVGGLDSNKSFRSFHQSEYPARVGIHG